MDHESLLIAKNGKKAVMFRGIALIYCQSPRARNSDAFYINSFRKKVELTTREFPL